MDTARFAMKISHEEGYCIPAKYIVKYKLQGENDDLQTEVMAFDHDGALDAVWRHIRRETQNEFPEYDVAWTSIPWYYHPELAVYQGKNELRRYVDFRAEEVPLKAHTFYSVRYATWGADRPSEAWFDDLEKARRFADRDYSDGVKVHRCTDSTKIRYYAMLAGVDPYLEKDNARERAGGRKAKKHERDGAER